MIIYKANKQATWIFKTYNNINKFNYIYLLHLVEKFKKNDQVSDEIGEIENMDK